ncbi:MAG: class I SAM-dependent methyltransferase [Methanotrichaceae archaeon]|nr:class I SAM-dependent methyltransferase [Methanotrichaceae archaeon]
MNSYPAWLYDEFRQIGTDYESDAEVEAYDQRMHRLRDVQGEAKKILYLLDLQPEHTLIEIGTGTGDFAMAAARKCSKVIAIDVSESMLKYAERKARAKDIKNIQFIRAGFLTYQHQSRTVDVVVSQLALHHLPDFWKQIALLRISEMIKPGGKLYIKDIIYSFDPKKSKSFFERYITDLSTTGKGDPGYFIKHVKDEYSTLTWILDGMIKKASFRIDWTDNQDEFIAAYLCTRI